jgi:hypothetical protein
MAADMHVDPLGRLFVLDRGRQRVVVFTADGDSMRATSEFALPAPAGDMCLIGQKLFLLANVDGSLVHEVGPDGSIVRSFAKRIEGTEFTNALTALGRIACSEAASVVAVAPRTLADIYLYSTDGSLLRTDTIPGYSQTVYDIDGPSIRPRLPPSGFLHLTATLTWIRGTTLLVQLEREPSRGGELLESHLLRLHDGWNEARLDWPRVVAAKGDTLYTASAGPRPIVSVYHVR